MENEDVFTKYGQQFKCSARIPRLSLATETVVVDTNGCITSVFWSFARVCIDIRRWTVHLFPVLANEHNNSSFRWRIVRHVEISLEDVRLVEQV